MFPICQEILSQPFNRWELKDLLKAVLMSKPIIRQGLVQVERVVVRPGSKTFTQKFYVRPDQVKNTDRVVLGHHNLPAGHSARPAEVRALSSNKTVTDEIKQKTAEFYSLFSDDKSFYDYIQHLGISWKDSDKRGIVMMRAKRALNNAQANGMNIDDIKPTKKSPPPSNPPATSNPPDSATKQQNKMTSQPPPAPAPSPANSPAKKSIPEIVANPIKAAQDFIDTFAGPREFCRAMLNMSIVFKRDYDHKTNFENAKKSLIQHMAKGVDVAALWKMDKKQLWDGIIAAPPNPPPPVQHSSGTTRTFSSVKDVNQYFLGVDGLNQRHDANSLYGKWLNSAPDGTLPDFDEDNSTKTFGEMEQKVMTIYTHHSRDFNRWLRGTFAPKTWGKGSYANIPQILQFFRRVKFMDEAIERFELPEPITNHRYTLCEPNLSKSGVIPLALAMGI